MDKALFCTLHVYPKSLKMPSGSKPRVIYIVSAHCTSKTTLVKTLQATFTREATLTGGTGIASALPQ